MHYRYRRSKKDIIAIICLVIITALAITSPFLIKKNSLLKKQLENANSEITAMNEQDDKESQEDEKEDKEKENQEYSFAYQTMFPEMHTENEFKYVNKGDKTVYLTFDDGPSALTYEILDILDEYNAKATFFVIGKNISEREALLKRMVDSGHTVAIHTYSHEYNDIYESVDSFLEDFNKTYEKIYEATGVYPTLFRFPGGSINSYNKDMYQELIAEMLRRGFDYFDWNISSEDATGKKYTSEQLCSNVLKYIDRTSEPIVLMHDASSKKTTVGATRLILEDLTAKGYKFGALDNAVKPVSFSYKE